MWVIEMISAVLLGNIESRFNLAAFVLEKPRLWENLKQDPLLKILAVIRQPNAKNYNSVCMI
ncbi:hypothetical protein CDG76_09800 [Nostoc sp. 'Peltigera membranacea cyanobiont' 210A]|uniref:hypothetical protein n=1 Tax=Nostoc sp. 'Peltigera membranacea cyanobiont' 210A TaxID=2014529 RepID=UPI000B95242E|nr:hypothetical protein [Nostoc sp. 'Peltigera membranacea cyanobiont' 210A]OYD95272.1 hypothetical protein CDG76_09800 [Nostoc sp. 'Peltigera membranacea cyanobiont' 210A]